VRAAQPLLCLALLTLSTGCWDLLPASRDPKADAEHRMHELCPGAMPKYPDGLFNPESVVSVAPLYYTKSERGYQGQYLFGAIVTLRPFPGVTTQELEWMLNCHSARCQLQQPGEPCAPNDPYWVPGKVVRISVDFDEGLCKVKVEGKDFPASKEALSRAVAFSQKAPVDKETPADAGGPL
jgi:hypothetical protein